MLEALQGARKRLFIVTNSPYWFIAPLLEHFVGADWPQFFDVVVASAKKPSWFTASAPSAPPLRKVMRDGRHLSTQPVARLEAGCAYAGGSADELMALTGWTGRRVLYLGDHIFADLVDARRSRHNWLTGADQSTCAGSPTGPRHVCVWGTWFGTCGAA